MAILHQPKRKSTTGNEWKVLEKNIKILWHFSMMRTTTTGDDGRRRWKVRWKDFLSPRRRWHECCMLWREMRRRNKRERKIFDFQSYKIFLTLVQYFLTLLNPNGSKFRHFCDMEEIEIWKSQPYSDVCYVPEYSRESAQQQRRIRRGSGSSEWSMEKTLVEMALWEYT